MTNNNQEITPKEVIDAIEAIPEDKISLSGLDYITFYGKGSNIIKVSSNGIVRLNGNVLVTLDLSYTERLFNKVYDNSLKKHKAKIRNTFEEFKNG